MDNVLENILTKRQYDGHEFAVYGGRGFGGTKVYNFTVGTQKHVLTLIGDTKDISILRYGDGSSAFPSNFSVLYYTTHTSKNLGGEYFCILDRERPMMIKFDNAPLIEFRCSTVLHSVMF